MTHEFDTDNIIYIFNVGFHWLQMKSISMTLVEPIYLEAGSYILDKEESCYYI